MLIDPHQPVIVGVREVPLDEALQIHTGVAFMSDPAVLAALLPYEEEAFGIANLPPSTAHHYTRIDHIRLTPRLTITVSRDVIRSAIPHTITTSQEIHQ